MGTNGAALTSYVPFSDAVRDIAIANHPTDRLAVLAHPRTFSQLDKLTDTTNQPLQPVPSYLTLKRLQATSIPIDETQGTATDASTAFVGDFRQLMVGVRNRIQIEVSRTAGDGTDGAFSKYQIWLRAVLRADVQAMHADAFTRIIGLIA